MKLTPEQTASQLRCPHGEAGAELGQSMNLRNLTQILSAYAAARITHGNRILDIGCGNGGLLGYILSQADNLHYTGLEISPLMVEQAQAFNAPFIAARKAEYLLYNGTQLPFEDNTFDAVVSVNTVYFWHDAPEMLAEICRVLKPAGRLALGFCEQEFMSKLPFTEHEFMLYNAADIRDMAAELPLTCALEERSRDWAVSKSGALVRREFVDVAFTKTG